MIEGLLVLIVQDNEALTETTAAMVREAGYAMVVAHHGRQALELARLRRPALVITDLMLPLLSGASVITALREDAERHAFLMPATILVTGVSVVRAREAGADVVLRKPFHVQDLERLLRRFLGPPGATTTAEALTSRE